VSDPDPSLIKIYVDGQEQTLTTDVETGWSNNNGPSVGPSPGGFKGDMDELAVFNRKITKEEALKIYQRQSPYFSGRFDSQIFDAGKIADWSKLAWKTPQPYGKRLLSSNESLYSHGNINSSGLVRLWHLDDDGSSLNGSHSGGVLFEQPGQIDKAARFDGVDDVISEPDADELDLTDGELTLLAWIHPMSFGASNRGRIFDNMDSGTGGYAFRVTELMTLPSNGLALHIEGGGTYVSDANIIDISRWQLVAVTLSSGTLTFYVNGAQRGTVGSVPTPTASNRPLTIGNNGSLDSGFEGLIDEAAIFSRALSQQEIKNIYERGAMRLKFQVRSCTDNVCSSETWKGPDGTADTFFSELLNSTPAFPLFNPTNYGGANRYFQYRTYFESDLPTKVPEISDVSIEAKGQASD
jgi:hypothetical protein